MLIEKNLFHARVGAENFNIRHFKQKFIIHNDKYIPVMPVKISSCFMLIISSLLFALYVSLFLINFKTTPEVDLYLK